MSQQDQTTNTNETKMQYAKMQYEAESKNWTTEDCKCYVDISDQLVQCQKCKNIEKSSYFYEDDMLTSGYGCNIV